MILSSEKLNEFEKKLMSDPRVVPTPNEALKIFEWLWMEACHLGSMPPDDYLEDLYADLEIARTLKYFESRDPNV